MPDRSFTRRIGTGKPGPCKTRYDQRIGDEATNRPTRPLNSASGRRLHAFRGAPGGTTNTTAAGTAKIGGVVRMTNGLLANARGRLRAAGHVAHFVADLAARFCQVEGATNRLHALAQSGRQGEHIAHARKCKQVTLEGFLIVALSVVECCIRNVKKVIK